MKISDLITAEIIKLINESEGNTAEIQRNELANIFGCAPSQINYVLASRFTPEHGYVIESRRGGGGYIKIRRVVMSHSSAIMHIINSIGDEIDSMTTRIVLENCLEAGLLDEKNARIMASALSNHALQSIPVIFRDAARASILKQMLLTLL